jgi:hypothetical protein
MVFYIYIKLYNIGLLVKFTAYIELKAMFQKASSDPDASLQPWQHMVCIGNKAL